MIKVVTFFDLIETASAVGTTGEVEAGAELGEVLSPWIWRNYVVIIRNTWCDLRT